MRRKRKTEKGNIWRSLTSFFAKEIFGEGKNIFRRRRKTEKGKEENIWRRKNIFGRRGKTENENEESIWRRKIFGRRTLKPKNPKILSARLSRAELSVVKGKFYIKSKST